MFNHLIGLDYHGRRYKIAVVSPSGVTLDPTVWDRVQQAAKATGCIQLVAPVGMLDPSIIPYHANSDENRFKYLQEALIDDTVDAIWCLRGGYGAARLIENLSSMPKPATPKLLIGYSDITALLLFVYNQWGWMGMHGPGLAETVRINERDQANFQKIFDLLSGTHNGVIATDLKPFNAPAQQDNKFTGRLTGGNLTLCETSIGTSWQLKTAGNIVMLEDTHEDGYAIDRSLYHMCEAGLLDDAAAIVLGCFSGGDAHVEFALQRFAEEIAVPVFRSESFGHSYYNYPFLYGVEGEILANGADFILQQPERAII